MEAPEDRHPRALIVDDEKDICYLLAHILKLKKINTTLAGNLKDAEKCLESQSPDLLFLDNHLPDGFGLDNVERLKKASPSTCVIMITAHDSEDDRKKAFQHGVEYFLSKPFTREQVLKTVELINGK